MKDKHYLLIGFVSMAFMAGILIVSLSEKPLLSEISLKKKVELKESESVQPKEGIVTGDIDKKSRFPISGKHLENIDPQTLAVVTGAEPTTDTANNETEEKTEPENDKNIVDKELLRNKFPDKSDLIPITDEEIEARKLIIRESFEQFGKILANKATEDEINVYYDEKTRLTKDRIEILDYAISEFGDKLSDDGMRRQVNTLMTLESQLSKIPERRERAIARLKKMEGGNEDG